MSISQETRKESMQETYKSVVKVSTQVYGVLLHAGPLSAWEIAAIMGRMVYTVRPRLSELKDQLWIKEVGTRYCATTNRKEAVWDVCDKQMPLI